jgi:DNA-binding NtrC family response regulator
VITPDGLPRLLIIDDLFGRIHEDRRNEERANLCGQYLIQDVTGDEIGKGSEQRIKRPVAQAVFCRGQKPALSVVGDQVENDLDGTLRVIQEGWSNWQKDRPRWAMILLDLCFYTGTVTKESDRKTSGMPEGRPDDDDPEHYFGLRLLKAIHNRFPDLPVVILSSKPRGQVSREFSQHGALAFLPRGEENSRELLREYIRRHALIPDETDEIIGHSTALLLTLRAARRAALDQFNVLIRGERGTGKELLARYIHRHGSQVSERPLVVVDSGALSPQLYASELFGHKRGAFTGAERDRKGRILQADGGDLFLDEIGNMPVDVQVGLLRVLEQREVTPLGALEGQPVNVRFIAATNEDLEGKAAAGGFRKDLLDRLREGSTIYLQPLRERLDDLDRLVEGIVRAAEQAKPGVLTRQIEPATLERLRSYDWPGNVRELRSCLYNAVYSYPDVEHLQPIHLRFDETILRSSEQARVISAASQARDLRGALPEEMNGDLAARSLDALITEMNEFQFENIKPAALLNKLNLLQEAYAHLAAQLLKAALQATSKPTPDNPEGDLLIHPAIKLVTGDKTITASKAADVIKRLFALHPEVEKLLDADPVLKQAYETALRLRPRQPAPRTTLTSDEPA